MQLIRYAFVLSVAWVGFVFAATPVIWDGSAATYWYNPNQKTFSLNTAAQLAGLAQLVNEDGIDFAGKKIKITEDIFLNDTTGYGTGIWDRRTDLRQWISIGNENHPFAGEIDGRTDDGKRTIYGLYINDKSRSYVGFLGKVKKVNDNECSLVNLNFSVGKIDGKNYVGTVVGSGDSLNIDSVYSNVYVSGSDYVGGLVGEMRGLIAASRTDGDVKASGNYVGGIAGYLRGFLGSVQNYGNVSGLDYVGGLVGKNYGDYYDGYNYEPPQNNFNGVRHYIRNVGTNSISVGSVVGRNYVGGALGLDVAWGRGVSPRVSSSSGDEQWETRMNEIITYGVVKGSDNVGGIVGKMDVEWSWTSSEDHSPKFESELSFCIHRNGKIEARNYVGGIVGNTHGTSSSVFKSYSEADVYGTGNYVGGLAGKVSGVRKSHVEGHVKSDSSYVGGVAGYASYIDSSYHIHGNVEGFNYVGGVVGKGGGIYSVYHIGGVVGKGGYVGGVAGYSIGGISDSYAEGDVVGTKDYVGGVVGSCGYGRQDVQDVKRSFSKGNVRGYADSVGGIAGAAQHILYSYHIDGKVEGGDVVGGLVGYLYGTIDSSFHKGGNVSGNNYVGGLAATGAIIKNSYMEGNVEGKGGYVGGVLGKGNNGRGFIDSSYHANGNVSGDSIVGGLAGFVHSVRQSYSKGNVVGTGNYVGGIAGMLHHSARNSYSMAYYIKGKNEIGGLAGRFNKAIMGGVNNGDTLYTGEYSGDALGIFTSYFEGDSVIGFSQVGGLVGHAKSPIDSSYSTANVKGTDNVGGLIGGALDRITYSMALGNVSGSENIGGLVGRFEGPYIFQSYENGDVEGNNYIGGLVGYANGNGKNFHQTYAGGSVTGETEDPIYIGCLVGFVEGSLYISQSFFDKDNCGFDVNSGVGQVSVQNPSKPGKTTMDMKNQSTFDDWDFTVVWGIMENTYPFLQMYGYSLANADVTTESLEGFQYDGNEKKPQVTSVIFGGKILMPEDEYTVSYKDNINAGSASIEVCGVSPYRGCKTVNFEISGIPVNVFTDAPDAVIYSGWEQKPNFRVWNSDDWQEGGVVPHVFSESDYDVEYKDNVNVGTATIIVTMKGNYSGSATKSFMIEKAPTTILQNPKAGDIIEGQTLSSSQLVGGFANTDGVFIWKTPEMTPQINNEGYAVIFVPNDTKNYSNSTEIIIPVGVLVNAVVCIGGNEYYAETMLDSVALVMGSVYTLPNAPSRYGFVFDGFYKGGEKIENQDDGIVINENTSIEAVYSLKKYTIEFLSESEVLQSSEFEYGTIPSYEAEPPTKVSTEQYSYSFKNWYPLLQNVTGNMTYTAVFDSVVNKYTVMFKNGETVLKSDEVSYGTKPIAPTVTLPANTAQYTYKFDGWDKQVVAVTGPATYYAVIDSVLNQYVVELRNYDGTLIWSALYDYGTSPASIINPTNPTRENSAEYTYSFKGWSPTLATVTGNAAYTAVYDSIAVSRPSNAIVVDDSTTNRNSAISESYKHSSNVNMRITTVLRSILITTAPIGSAYAIFDMQGRVLKKGRVDSSNYNIPMNIAGNYLVRVGNRTQQITIK